MPEVVGIAGDWHGNWLWAKSCLKAFAESGVRVVYQVGDFGIWPGPSGEWFLKEVMEACAELKMKLWVVPGNHEDYSQIMDREDPNGGAVRQILGAGPEWEVALLPRGYSWQFGGKKFVALGGAPSIDFENRTEGLSWWPEEMIRESDLERLGRSVGADVMLAHDAPDGGTATVQRIIDTPAEVSGWTIEGLAYAERGRKLMNEAVGIVKPAVFIHGHMHVTDERLDEELDRLYVSMGSDGELGNIGVLHLDEKPWMEWMEGTRLGS